MDNWITAAIFLLLFFMDNFDRNRSKVVFCPYLLLKMYNKFVCKSACVFHPPPFCSVEMSKTSCLDGGGSKNHWQCWWK